MNGLGQAKSLAKVRVRARSQTELMNLFFILEKAELNRCDASEKPGFLSSNYENKRKNRNSIQEVRFNLLVCTLLRDCRPEEQ